MPPKKGTTAAKPTPNAAAPTTIGSRPRTRAHMQDTLEVRSQSPDPDTSDKDDNNSASNPTVTDRINQLSAHGAELQDSVEGLRDQLSSIDDRFQRFDTRLDNIMNAITEFNRNRVELRRESTPASDHGTIPPARILEHFLS